MFNPVTRITSFRKRPRKLLLISDAGDYPAGTPREIGAAAMAK
jgi:hypothetical protein